MKNVKSAFVLLIVLGLVLVACSKQATTTVVTPAQPSQPAASPPVTTAPAPVTPTAAQISTAEQQGVACLTPGVRVCAPVNFAQGSVGDTLVFPFAFSNQLPTSQKFVVTISYVSTQFSMGVAPVDISKDNMADWVSGNKLQTSYTLDPQGKQSIPIQINIGSLVNMNTPTPSGATFVFEAKVSMQNNLNALSDYDTAKTFSVRVK